MKILITITCFVLGFIFYNNEPDFSYKVYGNIANFFENKKDLEDFFEFKKHDVVAEVGANNGQNIAGLSLLADSITFYAEDINAKSLNEKNLKNAIDKCSKYKSPQTNSFKLQIGTEKETFLPDHTFDKIILSSTFHEFTYMNEMLSDIHKKLKSDGKLYILESHCFSKTHKNYTAEETEHILKEHHFTLLKKDGKDLNGGTGVYRLVFSKN
jgi:ubiquinone/menaquinone biosynthesis C-methylase UbiE